MTGQRHDEVDAARRLLSQAVPLVGESHALTYALAMALASTAKPARPWPSMTPPSALRTPPQLRWGGTTTTACWRSPLPGPAFRAWPRRFADGLGHPGRNLSRR